jgi:HD-GYP domain-containing protein (c-di-GMP phosphodiesterase class II)
VEGLRWEADQRLRIGRNANDLDIELHDSSVSPRHTEVIQTRQGWVVRDLTSRASTLLNGVPLNGRERLLRSGDVVQVGRVVLSVDLVLDLGEPLTHASVPPPPSPHTRVQASPASVGPAPVASPSPDVPAAATAEGGTAEPALSAGLGIKTSGSYVKVEAASQHSWEEAMEALCNAGLHQPWQQKRLMALLRAGYSMSQIASLPTLLQSVLEDAVQVLGAQRGSIVLRNDQTGELELKSVCIPRSSLKTREYFSRTLAERSFSRGESLLCSDVTLDTAIGTAGSVTRGTMASIICALLRTPRQRLGVLHLDRGPFQESFGREEFHLADAIAATVSAGIESAILVEKQRQQFVQTVTALGRAVEIRDFYTANHTSRVTMYSLLLADELRLSPQDQYHLQIGTPLHDIGKIGIEDAILRKPDRLTFEEFEAMKKHTVMGAAILETIPSLSPVVTIARHHHERWDGRGYPDGLASDRISLLARIVAVADAFDAMTSDRPYRKALPLEVAFRELQEKAGEHFDPICVQAFLRIRQKIETVRAQDGTASSELKPVELWTMHEDPTDPSLRTRTVK